MVFFCSGYGIGRQNRALLEKCGFGIVPVLRWDYKDKSRQRRKMAWGHGSIEMGGGAQAMVVCMPWLGCVEGTRHASKGCVATLGGHCGAANYPQERTGSGPHGWGLIQRGGSLCVPYNAGLLELALDPN